MSNREYFQWLGDWCWVILLVCLVSTMFSAKAEAHDRMERWGIPWKGDVEINLFQGQCSNEQAAAIERSLVYGTYELSRADPSRSYRYLGRTLFPGWLNHFDEIVTFDCSNTVVRNQNGEAVLIDNCPNNNSTVETECEDGTPRHIIDAYVRINVIVPEWRIGNTTLHEFGHVLTLEHSTTPGATMKTGVFCLQYCSQLKETWSRDDWCSIRNVLPTMTEWPITTTTIDDENFIHIPWVMPPAWLDTVPYYIAMIYENGVWHPKLNYKPVATCESLEN